ncbi:MAG: TIR domain-containing protein [Kineosporiaceae bacterium]|nr:TIR domain-containing protein [Kineosporiaceae bacterium]
MPLAQSPPAGSAAPLYFVCYSRDERDLAGKVEAKLAARRRRGEIDLWRDVRNLDVWEEFTPEIQRVLASAAGAIIIISDSWSVSTYIQEHEWPTVLARASEPGFGVFLLAVHDLDSDDPLRLRTFVNDLREELLVAADDATRDRVLTRLSDLVGRHARTVSAAAGPGDGDLHAVPDDVAPPQGRAPAQPGPAPGESEAPEHPGEPGLYGLPSIPEQFVEPTESVELGELLVTEPVVALVGEGGTGKSVLAGAVTRRIAGSFPGGAIWVTVGELATSEDVRRLQAQLLERLQHTGVRPQDINHGKKLLAAALPEAGVLLVIDDVWHPWQSRAFDVQRPGTRSRILFTTRFVEALPVASVRVELRRLTAAQATTFLAALPLGAPTGPDDLAAVLDAAGGLRLALAVLAATARVEGGWPAVLGRLPGLSARFGSGDDASSAQKALWVAIDTLDPPDRRRALSLGTFPPDTTVPARVLADVWSLGPAEAEAVLDRLVAKDIAVRSGDGIVLHDHVHDFLVLQASEPTADVHLRLWELALAAGPGRWAELADRSPYLWDHLVWHACRAGLNRSTLRTLAGDLDRLAERIRRQGPAAAEAEVTAVCQATAVGADEPLHLMGRVLRHGALFRAAGHERDLTISLEAWADAVGLGHPGERRLRYGTLPVPSAQLRGSWRGHTADVWAVTPSPDGRLVATGAGDGTTRLWDAVSGEHLLTLDAAGPVGDVAFSPDGRQVAAGCADGGVRLWDTHDGGAPGLLRGDPDEVWSVCFCPDGRRLAAACASGTVSVWEVASGRRELVLEAGTPVWAVAFSPDGARVAGAGRDGVVRSWDAVTGAPLGSLVGHTDQVRALAFTRDGSRLASCGDDGTVRIWQPDATEPLHVMAGHGEAVWGVAFDRSGSLLASAGFDGTAQLWDVATGGRLAVLEGHSNAVHDVAFLPGREQVVTCGADTTARIWDVTDLADLGDGPAAPSPRPGRAYGVVVSHDRNLIATAHADGRAVLCDAADGGRASDLVGHTAPAWGVQFSPDDTRLASTSWDGTVRVWDVGTRSELLVLTGHRAQVWDVAYSPDGHLLATAGEDGTVRLWNADTGEAGPVLAGHTRQVRAVEVCPDGRVLASVGDDGTVRLWDLTTATPLRTLTGHRSQVWDVTFASDGRTVVSSGEDGTVRLWEVASGEAIGTLTGPGGPVYHLALAPDGRHLASGSSDGAARIWHLGTGECVLTLALACTGPVAWIATGLDTGLDNGLATGLAVGAGGHWAVVNLPPLDPDHRGPDHRLATSGW